MWKKKNKYSNIKIAGYDSKKEHKRALELKLLERGGIISNLQEQVRFTLLPTFKDNQGVTERSIVYVADFTYDENGESIVEDVKGFKTAIYIIKRKLFKSKYPGMIFREV